MGFRSAPDRLAVTVSIGVALGDTDLISIADRRLYEAKDAGRNRISMN